MIDDATEFAPFPAFANNGIITTDTFDDWRKKDNGVIQQLNLLEQNSASTGVDFNNTTATIRIKTGGVVADNIAANAVTESKILNGAVTNGKLGAGAVTGAKIAAATIAGSNIAAATIAGSNIAAATIIGSNIAANTIQNGNIADGTITGAKIAAATIAGSNIIDSTIIGSKIASATITGSNIAANTIQNGNIADGTITGAKIAAATISGSNIAGSAIAAAHIANNAVIKEKIASGAISTSKMSGWGFNESSPVYGVRAFGYVGGDGVLYYNGNGSVLTSWRMAPGFYAVSLVHDSTINFLNVVVSCEWYGNDLNYSAKVAVMNGNHFHVRVGFADAQPPQGQHTLSDCGFFFTVMY